MQVVVLLGEERRGGSEFRHVDEPILDAGRCCRARPVVVHTRHSPRRDRRQRSEPNVKRLGLFEALALDVATDHRPSEVLAGDLGVARQVVVKSSPRTAFDPTPFPERVGNMFWR